MYVCTVVIPYYVLIQNYIETFSRCKLAPTHHHTIQCHIHYLKLFNIDSCCEDTAEDKRQSKYNGVKGIYALDGVEEKNRERRDRETAEEIA